MAERRIAEHASPLELRGEEALDVVPEREPERSSVGLERLQEHEARRVPPAPAGELRHELERSLFGAEVRHREAAVGVDDGGEAHVAEVMPLRDHLRADEHDAIGRAKAVDRLAQGAGARRRVRVEPDPLQLRHRSRQLRLEPLRPGAHVRELGRAAGGAEHGHGLATPAVVAVQPPVPVQRQRDVAVRAPPRRAARPAVQRRRDATAVEQENSLAAFVDEAPELGEKRGRERVAGLATEVDEAHARHRGSDTHGQRHARQALPALGPGRGAPVDGDRALERRPLRRDRARVVSRVGLLLERRVVLLVDDDQADAAHRCEHGRARSDDDARLAPGDPVALVAPLRVRERPSGGSRRCRRTCARSAPPSAA